MLPCCPRRHPSVWVRRAAGGRIPEAELRPASQRRPSSSVFLRANSSSERMPASRRGASLRSCSVTSTCGACVTGASVDVLAPEEKRSLTSPENEVEGCAHSGRRRLAEAPRQRDACCRLSHGADGGVLRLNRDFLPRLHVLSGELAALEPRLDDQVTFKRCGGDCRIEIRATDYLAKRTHAQTLLSPGDTEGVPPMLTR